MSPRDLFRSGQTVLSFALDVVPGEDGVRALGALRPAFVYTAEPDAISGASGFTVIRGVTADDGENCLQAILRVGRGAAVLLDGLHATRALRAANQAPERRTMLLGVMADPVAASLFSELERLREQSDAGADFIQTPPSLDNRYFLDFRDHCARAGLRPPLLAAVRPATAWAHVLAPAGFGTASGIPPRLLRGFDRGGNDPAMIRRVGLHHAAEQCLDLHSRGVSGLLLHTGDTWENIPDIMRRIGPQPP